MLVVYAIITISLITGCSKTFEMKLVAGGVPQEVKCTLKPDTELGQFPKPGNIGSDFKILMEDLTAYLYNPAVAIDCDY
jgi:hypothetical protein